MVRFAAFITVFGIVLNRLNTALIAFNWKLYPEIPHWREVVISMTIFAIYIVTYRFILYRLPILYAWKEAPAFAVEPALEKSAHGVGTPALVEMYRKTDR